MALLMISSQLLLTAFVIYWLTGQYREERIKLHGQLTEEYFLVFDQLIDSMLMQQMVIPSLEDSISLSFPPHESGLAKVHTDSTNAVFMMKQYYVEVPDEEVTLTYEAKESPHSGTILRRQNVTTVISEEERMVRSIRLFINENQEAFRDDTSLHIFAMNLDSCSLAMNMEGVLTKNNWSFDLQWPGEDLNNSELEELHGLLLKGGPSRPLPPLQVQHYRGFLLAALIPQILFAVVLLLLSGSALLFAYRSLRKQLALNKLRNDFVGNISHELKTPVSTVKVALEALRTYDLHKDPAVAEEYLAMASSELERLEQLVGRVLQHELLDNPTLVLEKEICHPNDLAYSVVQSLELPIREAGAKVNLDAGSETCQVYVDRIYVEGVIMNLLDNSLKYGGENPEIEIKTHCDAQGTYLSVLDHGPGIPAEYKDQLFEKFYRVPSGDQHNVKGYGLGLNFAYQVMKKHGGSISYNNLSGGGSNFTLHFQKEDQ